EGGGCARGRPAPDGVLLAGALPDGGGIEVARRLRGGSNGPIIMLTARRNEIDKITGLDAGADDYVTKPFSHGELLARIRAQIRRGPTTAVTSQDSHGVYTLGQFRLDTGIPRVTPAERGLDGPAPEFENPRRAAGGRWSRRRAAPAFYERVGAQLLRRRACAGRVRAHDTQEDRTRPQSPHVPAHRSGRRLPIGGRGDAPNGVQQSMMRCCAAVAVRG